MKKYDGRFIQVFGMWKLLLLTYISALRSRVNLPSPVRGNLHIDIIILPLGRRAVYMANMSMKLICVNGSIGLSYIYIYFFANRPSPFLLYVS